MLFENSNDFFPEFFFSFLFTNFHFYPQFLLPVILKLSHPLTRAALLVFHASLFILSFFSKLGTGYFQQSTEIWMPYAFFTCVNTVDRTILSKTMTVPFLVYKQINVRGKSDFTSFWYLYDHHRRTYRALVNILKLLSYGLLIHNSNHFLESMHNALYFTTPII